MRDLGSRAKSVGVRVPSGAPIKDAVDDTIHCVFYLCIGIGTRMIKSQYAGGILLQPVQKLVATLIFALTDKGKNANESLPAYQQKDGVNDRFTPSFIFAKRKGLKRSNPLVAFFASHIRVLGRTCRKRDMYIYIDP